MTKGQQKSWYDQTMRIAFATTDDPVLAGENVDRPYIEEAFRDAGVTVEFPVWSDPLVQWDEFDMVIPQSPWDFSTQRAKFQ